MSNREDVISVAMKIDRSISIHTFGMGGECDKKLIERLASVGRGESNLINNINLLKPKVVQAL